MRSISSFVVGSQVIKGSEILEVLHGLPAVRQYLFSLYECRYSVFFQSLGESVVSVCSAVRCPVLGNPVLLLGVLRLSL